MWIANCLGFIFFEFAYPLK